MTRPDWENLLQQTAGSYVSCRCGDILKTIDEVHDHWQRGHFDSKDARTAIRLLFDPLERLGAVTVLDEPPNLYPGDQVTVTMRVTGITRCPIGDDRAFWMVTLEPDGEAFIIGGQPLHIAATVVLQEPA